MKYIAANKIQENIIFTLTECLMKKRPQFTDFITLVNEKNWIRKIHCEYDKQATFF